MQLLIFYPLAAACVIAAIAVVASGSPIASAVSLIGMMLGLAGIFALQNAHFIAILQVIIYAGAIMVLFLFVIMLLNLKGGTEDWKTRGLNTPLGILGGLLATGILFIIIAITRRAALDAPKELSAGFGTTVEVGKALFTDFVLPFEAASILLLVAIIGALVLAKTKVD